MIVKARLDIVQHGQILKQTDVLEGPGDSGLVYFRGFLAGNVDSRQLNASRVRLIYACQQVENGGLTGSVWSDKAVKLPLFYADLKVVNCLKAAKRYA